MDLAWFSALPPCANRRRRRETSGVDRDSKNFLATKMTATLLSGRHGAWGRSSSSATAAIRASPQRRRAKKKTSVTSKAKAVALSGCMLSGGLNTVVVGFSAVCSPPPRAPHEHQQQLSTPPSTTPQARRFLEDIISSQQEQQPSSTSWLRERGEEKDRVLIVGARDAASAAATAEAEEELEREVKPATDLLPDSNKKMTLEMTDRSESGAIGPAPLQTAAAEVPSDLSVPRMTRERKERRGANKPNSAAQEARDAEKTRSDAETSTETRLRPGEFYDYDDPTSKRRKLAIHTMCAELCQSRLLTRDEEYELGTKIQALMSYNAMKDRLLTRLGREPTLEEWAESCCMTAPELQENLKVCRSAKESMIRANMRMVISIARKYQNLGVPLSDLIQEGSLGLVRAVEKFDPERGFKLSTYSAWWIQQAVFKGIAYQNRVIRLPMHVHNLLNSVRKAKRELETSDGPEPTDLQVALHLDMPVQRLKRYLAVTKETISFEVPACAPEISSKRRLLGDTLASRDFKHPEKESDSELFRVRLREIVEELPEDERTVVSLRFGLDNGKPKTLGQIAEIVRTSTPYVRRVEMTALRRLRSSHHRKRLGEFQLLPLGSAAGEVLSKKH